MRLSTKFLTAFAVAGLAMTPAKAHALTPPGCVGGPVAGYQLGLGGYLTGCWGTLNMTRLYEYAYDNSSMYWFSDPSTAAVLPTTTSPYNTDLNAPSTTLGVNYLFNDNCGSNGVNDGGVFCSNSGGPMSITWTNSQELVFGLDNSNPESYGGAAGAPGMWVYSGTNTNRNATPSPAGMQAVLLQVTGFSDGNSHFLLGWEDRNSGCLANSGITSINMSVWTPNTIPTGLANVLNTCTSANAGGQSDSDFNDFYVLIDASTLGIPTDTVPEPMTMTLLATGLVGLGGASFRKRNKKS